MNMAQINFLRMLWHLTGGFDDVARLPLREPRRAGCASKRRPSRKCSPIS
jgi:hypothetical protein